MADAGVINAAASGGGAGAAAGAAPPGLLPIGGMELDDVKHLTASLVLGGAWDEPRRVRRQLERLWPVIGPGVPLGRLRRLAGARAPPPASRHALPPFERSPPRAGARRGGAPAAVAAAADGTLPLPAVPGADAAAVAEAAARGVYRRCGRCEACAAGKGACPVLAAVRAWDQEMGGVSAAAVARLAAAPRAAARRCGGCKACRAGAGARCWVDLALERGADALPARLRAAAAPALEGRAPPEPPVEEEEEELEAGSEPSSGASDCDSEEEARWEAWGRLLLPGQQPAAPAGRGQKRSRPAGSGADANGWVCSAAADGGGGTCGHVNASGPACAACGAPPWSGPGGQLAARVAAAVRSPGRPRGGCDEDRRVAARLAWEDGGLDARLGGSLAGDVAEERARLLAAGPPAAAAAAAPPAGDDAGAGGVPARRRVARSRLARAAVGLERACARLVEDRQALLQLARPSPKPRPEPGPEPAGIRHVPSPGPTLGAPDAAGAPGPSDAGPGAAAAAPVDFATFLQAATEALRDLGVLRLAGLDPGSDELRRALWPLFAAAPAGGWLPSAAAQLRELLGNPELVAALEAGLAGTTAEAEPPEEPQQARTSAPPAPAGAAAAAPGRAEQPSAAELEDWRRERLLAGASEEVAGFCWALLGASLAAAGRRRGGDPLPPLPPLPPAAAAPGGRGPRPRACSLHLAPALKAHGPAAAPPELGARPGGAFGAWAPGATAAAAPPPPPPAAPAAAFSAPAGLHADAALVFEAADALGLRRSVLDAAVAWYRHVAGESGGGGEATV